MKDSHRNKRYAGTQKCFCCEEESHIAGPLPILLSDLLAQAGAFVELHTAKGCNKVDLAAPKWASDEIEFGVVPGFELEK